MKNILPFLFLILFSCKTTEKMSTEELNKLVSTELGKGYESYDNGIYTLCVSQIDLENNRKTFLVIDSVSNSIVYGPEKLSGTMEWHSETVLRISESQGVVKDKNAFHKNEYYYDIVKKTKVNPTVNEKI